MAAVVTVKRPYGADRGTFAPATSPDPRVDH
jgi:hypothetical protein